MDPVGAAHAAAATVALLLGPAVFLRPKGDRLHRRVGYAYAGSMVVLNATAFAIYDMLGRWGPFHYAAVVSSATLAMGLVPAMLRRPRGSWLRFHYFGMCWSYVGLVAAGMAQLLSSLPRIWPALAAAAPAAYFWGATAVGTALVCALGVYFIRIRRLGFPRAA